MGFFKCQKCGAEMPDFDVAHVCAGGFKAGEIAVIAAGEGTGKSKLVEMWKKPMLIHGYRLELTCYACPEQYDVYAGDEMVAYFRLRHGHFRVHVPDYGGDVIYEASPEGDGVFLHYERVKYLTEAILKVQEYYLNRKWEKEDDY